MKVIVVFECSGVVRDAFLALGHDAWSCDLKMNYNGPHLKMDAREVDYSSFDLAIMHPPCTDLAISGALHFKHKTKEQEDALNLVEWCFKVPTPRRCIENPVSIISTHFRKPTQIVQPWYFGDAYQKRTCLWLRDLPELVPTNVIKRERYLNQTESGQNKLAPHSTRAAERARTYPGIAAAMAQQWGNPMFLW